MADFGLPFVSSTFSRVTNSLARDVALANLTRLQGDLLRTQTEASSGKRINAPSDDPIGATIVLNFRKRVERNRQFLRNLGDANGRLAVADRALGSALSLIDRARTLLLAHAQNTAGADARRAAAADVNALLAEARDIANTRFENRFLFAGGRQTERPFSDAPGGVAYAGDDAPPEMNLTDGGTVPVGVSGVAAFAGFSAAILGNTDLDPDIDAATPLSELNQGRGVRLGAVAVGTTAANLRAIDLRIAKTVGDVLDLINAQTAATGVTAAVDPVTGNRIVLTSGSTVLVQEVDGGRTAQDLGLPNLAAPAASPVVGGDVDPVMTASTPLSLLNGGAGLDLSGLVIANATSVQTFTATLSFAGLGTVQDALNRINDAGVFVRAEINASGTGINVRTRLSGARLTVAENGGATAAQLGILSTIGRARVADLNNGFGIETVDGDDIQIRRRDGTTFEVDLSGAVTAQDIVDAVNNDPQNGGTVLAALGAANNLVLTDLTGAVAAAFEVRNFNDSQTATQLGIEQTAAAAIVTGTNLNWAGDQAEGLFTALVRLRDALRADDTGAIRSAGRLVDLAQQQVLDSRAEVGASMVRFELTQGRLEDERDQVTELRSGIEDADLAEVATRLQLQQTTLQAALAVTARLLQTSLLNFL